jgi:hypothetical protein
MFKIAKSTGIHEPFDIQKIIKSLKKVGATDAQIEGLCDKIKKKVPKIGSTEKLYKFILRYMQDVDSIIASRYNLKYALMELGPAGYPFELFVGQLFKYQSYAIKMNAIVKGFCVSHEIDLFAKKSKEKIYIECKFHNRRGLKSDVKVTLYVNARFIDIKKEFKNTGNKGVQRSLIITNTYFTSEAVKYAECVGLDLIDWKYPLGNALPDIIHKSGLHPITTLTLLNRKQKRALIKHGFVLCRQAEENKKLLSDLGMTKHEINKIIEESKALSAV